MTMFDTHSGNLSLYLVYPMPIKHGNGKSLGKSWKYIGFSAIIIYANINGEFSIAMLDYQRANGFGKLRRIDNVPFPWQNEPQLTS